MDNFAFSTQVEVAGTSYAFSPTKRSALQLPIPTYPSDSPPPATNVFGLNQPTYNTKHYRVQDGASINCMAITTFPHEGPQWENVYHLLDLSQNEISWNWNDHFGFFPAVLLTVQTQLASEIECDYPEKEKYPNDRIATTQAIQDALRKVGYDPVLHQPFLRALLVRFSFQGEIIPFDSHSFGFFSCCAAKFLNELNPHLIAVQAPTFDRADCPHCDTHRVLFKLERSPPQKTLGYGLPQLMLGENFHFDTNLADGFYLLEAGGINLVGQDVTISSSYLYPIQKISSVHVNQF